MVGDGEDDEDEYEPLVHGPSPGPTVGRGAGAQVEKPYEQWLCDFYHMSEGYAAWYAWRNVDVNGVEW